MDELREAGYNGNKVFLGGHSLGAVFIPDFLEQWKDEVAGVVMLGAFHQRHGMSVDVPSLTLCGELDGLVRTSRIAESFHQNIIQKGNTKEQRLRNPIVLIEGMNHFQILEGDPHPMKQLRDLPAETDDETAKKEVSTTIANFLDVHNFDCKEAKNDRSILDVTKNHKQRNDLMSRVARTGEYLDPLIQAMKLEGNYHVDSSIQGCPLTEQAQKDILSGLPSTHHVKDQFRKSWYCNPFDKVPFSHPKVASVRTGSDEQQEVDLLTYSEAIYNNLDKILDTGFFSNTASEIQAKLNSPQAVLDAMGETTEYDPSSVHDIARRLNEKTITWALENVPEAVRQRYLERGIPVVTGSDIPHSSGPAWIWSFLKLQPEIQTDSATGESREVRVVQSHILSTPVDHPLTFLSGKMYCKLLSPAKVMEWMYTDSLREKNEFSLKNLFGGDRGTSPHHSDRNMGAGVFMTTDSAH